MDLYKRVQQKLVGHAIGHLRLRQPRRFRQARLRQSPSAREREFERVHDWRELVVQVD